MEMRHKERILLLIGKENSEALEEEKDRVSTKLDTAAF